jgi:SAM-dependent methyltransferase
MENKPFINWDELAKLAFRGLPGPQKGKDGEKSEKSEHKGPGPRGGIGGWDSAAENYNKMVQMEKRYTLDQLACIDVEPTDTVLDVCCGPGRLVVPLAKRAKTVTGLDASPKMFEYLDKYAEKEGVTNYNKLLLDWDEPDSTKDVEKHDIVVTSRCQAVFVPERLSLLAKKRVMMVIWANDAPPIPMIIGSLFEGTVETTHGHGHGFPGFPKPDRRLGNNILYNKVYDLGYEPNVRILDDGWERIFSNREEAYAELFKLAPGNGPFKDKVINEEVFRKNADKFLEDDVDGSVRYFAATKSFVIWWEV